MRSLDGFYEEYAESKNLGNCSEEKTNLYLGRFESRKGDSNEFVEHWKNKGFCVYADGLLTLCDPELLNGIKADFKIPNEGIIFGYTSLGDLFYWYDKHVHFLDIQTGAVEMISSDILMFLNVFVSDKEYYDDVFFGEVQREAIEKLGPIGAGECYILEPILALGGSRDVANLSKGDLLTYLSIVVQSR